MIRIARLDVFPLRFPMKRSFRISGGLVGAPQEGAPHIYVRITGDNGLSGWGEARPSPRWSYETPESVASVIHRYWKPVLIGRRADDLPGLHRQMAKETAGSLHPGHPIARAAVDTALHDLIARSLRVPLPGLWQTAPEGELSLSYLISTGDPEEAALLARTAKEQGFKGVDVKIGLNPARDVEILEAVKKEAPGLFYRVDANQAYTLDQAVKVAAHLGRIGVDVFEQPLPAGQLTAHSELRRKSPVPIALDESVWSPAGLMEAVRHEACDYAVIKLTKLGGLYGAKRCGELARECGLGLLGGGLTESKLGFAASAHLFRYLEIGTPVDLNGPFFLEDDAADEDWPVGVGGAVILQERPGIGPGIDPAKLERYLDRRNPFGGDQS